MKNNRVTILPSYALAKLKLNALAGKSGEIIETVCSSNGTVSGCWIWLDKSYMEEKEWFIPSDSLAI